MRKKSIKNYIVVCVVLCFIVLCFALYKLLLTDTIDTHAIYGERLDGIDRVRISNNTKKDIENTILETGKVKKYLLHIQGKIINVSIVVNDDISRDDSKSLANVVLEKLNEEEKAFYDVQVFIDKDSEDIQFPIIGYHHFKRDGFSFTLDR